VSVVIKFSKNFFAGNCLYGALLPFWDKIEVANYLDRGKTYLPNSVFTEVGIRMLDQPPAGPHQRPDGSV